MLQGQRGGGGLEAGEGSRIASLLQRQRVAVAGQNHVQQGRNYLRPGKKGASAMLEDRRYGFLARAEKRSAIVALNVESWRRHARKRDINVTPPPTSRARLSRARLARLSTAD